MMFKSKILFRIIFLFLLIAGNNSFGQGISFDEYRTVRIKPSATDKNINNWDSVHFVYFDPLVKNNKLLVCMGGTNGVPRIFPRAFVKTALELGYKVIILSYPTVPGVAAICKSEVLDDNPRCAESFRRYRTYGDNQFREIPDKPEDAIINRLTKLLQHLQKSNPRGDWGKYLDGDKPKWDKIALAGQSQGGGMAEFIAQNEVVDRVISFSGGWDFQNTRTKKLASWYSKPAKTPAEKWFGIYHSREAEAQSLFDSYVALGIPQNHIYGLKQDHRPNIKGFNPYHGEGLGNIIYKPLWEMVLDSGL